MYALGYEHCCFLTVKTLISWFAWQHDSELSDQQCFYAFLPAATYLQSCSWYIACRPVKELLPETLSKEAVKAQKHKGKGPRTAREAAVLQVSDGIQEPSDAPQHPNAAFSSEANPNRLQQWYLKYIAAYNDRQNVMMELAVNKQKAVSGMLTNLDKWLAIVTA